jgi:hypothetical protein
MIAEKPNMITRSLKKGIAITPSPILFAGFFNSIHLKKTNNKKAMLQMNVNFPKKENRRINNFCSENFHNNILKKDVNSK